MRAILVLILIFIFNAANASAQAFFSTEKCNIRYKRENIPDEDNIALKSCLKMARSTEVFRMKSAEHERKMKPLHAYEITWMNGIGFDTNSSDAKTKMDAAIRSGAVFVRILDKCQDVSRHNYDLQKFKKCISYEEKVEKLMGNRLLNPPSQISK